MTVLNLKTPLQSSQRQAIFIFFLIFLCSAVVLIGGLKSQVAVGDEIHHYRFAKHCFLQNGRAVFDSVYGKADYPAVLYTTDSAWPLGLAFVWRLFGHVSFPLAQIYQTGFYILSVFATYLATREIHGAKPALWSAFLAATLPMVVSFGILFYTDLPATAFIVFSFWFFLRKKYFWAGVTAAVQFLMK